jgi:hypothetical protein
MLIYYCTNDGTKWFKKMISLKTYIKYNKYKTLFLYLYYTYHLSIVNNDYKTIYKLRTPTSSKHFRISQIYFYYFAYV